MSLGTFNCYRPGEEAEPETMTTLAMPHAKTINKASSEDQARDSGLPWIGTTGAYIIPSDSFRALLLPESLSHPVRRL